MKKIISLLLSLVLMLSVCGCSKDNKSTNKKGPVNSEAKDEEVSDKEIESADSVTFAIFSDVHIGVSHYQEERFKKAIEWANSYDPVEFVLLLGDNVHDGRDKTLVTKFDELAASFEKPYYTLRGNHDFEEYDRNLFIECGDVAIVAFYSEIMWRNEKPYASGWGVPAEDLKWLEETLEKCRGKRVIFGCHVGIVQDNPNFNTWLESKAVDEKTGEVLLDFGREKILELAEKYNVELYFNGHEHNRDVPNGVAGTMIDFNLGSTGSDGVYMVVTIEPDKAILEVRNTGIDGIVRKLEYKFRFDIVK